MPEEKLSDAKIRNKKPSDKEEIITDLQSGVHLRECTENYWTLTQCNLLVHPMM